MARKLWKPRAQSLPCPIFPLDVPFISHGPGLAPLIYPGCEGEGASRGPVEAGETLTCLCQDTMAADSTSSPWPRGLSSQPLPLRPVDRSCDSTPSPHLIPHPVLRAAQIETKFETFSYFLVPLGTWVTDVLAANAHCASALRNWGPTQANSGSNSVRAGRDCSDRLV